MSKKGRKQIDQSRIDQIIKLRETGLTYREICEELGCGNSTISRYTVEQPTPTSVNVPKPRKATVNDGLFLFKDDAIYINDVSQHVLEEIQKLLQEDKMNQELNELHIEYMDKEEAIRGKYNVK